MIGGSYGGAVQFAAASIDPRIDTIVPVITWNDLSYSLAPNNTSQTTGVHATTPGSTKLVWGVGFSALGAAQGLEHVGEDPRRVLGCPNFATFVCPALLTGATAGFLGPRAVDKLRHASVTSYVKRVKVPVLLAQGEKDTLFNLNEAVATYQALRRQGTPVSMIWHSWGHSSAAAAPGEYDITAKPGTHYETDRVVAWFERYLKGRNVSTGPAFAYFRPWVAYRGSAAPAYAAANSFPVGRRTTWRLSGRGDLTTGASVAPGSQLIVTPVAGLSTSLASADIVADLFAGTLPLPEQSLPGTYAVWSAPAQRKPLDVAGIPQARLRVETVGSALTRGLGLDGGRGGLGISVGTGGSGGAGVSVGVDVSVSGNGRRAGVGDLVLFLSVVDIAPDGTRSMIDQTIAPVRVPDVTKAFTVNLPALVHRFEPGHRVGLVVAGSSVNYRGNLVPRIVTISAGKDQTLSLPVVG